VGGTIKILLRVRKPDATKCGVGHHEGISEALVYISYIYYEGKKAKRVYFCILNSFQHSTIY
jgi:hypothetical protein